MRVSECSFGALFKTGSSVMATNEQAHSVASSFQTGRVIEVYVGAITAESKPYLLPQTLLENASDYFTKALRSGSFKEGKEGRLHFPDDDSSAWEVLLYWLVKRHLPSHASDQLLMINCWALGDKYGITRFQDETMVELIIIYDDQSAKPDSIAKALEVSGPGSKMRKLIAEELTWVYENENISREDLGAIIDGTGIIVEFLAANELFREDEEGFANIFWKSNAATAGMEAKDRQAHWRDYLVGEEPVRHRVYDLELDQ
ncbi:hypothetical protein LTR85_005224 [Meristemomyces frigidus]|nr:hypothetical protein LTR85_005224 [Meristemomyces frigidus]